MTNNILRFDTRQKTLNWMKTAGYYPAGPEGKVQAFEHWRRSHHAYYVATEDRHGRVIARRYEKPVVRTRGLGVG